MTKNTLEKLQEIEPTKLNQRKPLTNCPNCGKSGEHLIDAIAVGAELNVAQTGFVSSSQLEILAVVTCKFCEKEIDRFHGLIGRI